MLALLFDSRRGEGSESGGSIGAYYGLHDLSGVFPHRKPQGDGGVEDNQAGQDPSKNPGVRKRSRRPHRTGGAAWKEVSS